MVLIIVKGVSSFPGACTPRKTLGLNWLHDFGTVQIYTLPFATKFLKFLW